jgi:hypothetical protein
MTAADLAVMVDQGLTSQGLALISGGQVSNAYTITATGRAGTGVVHVVRCLAEIGGAGNKAVKILRWLDQAPLEVEG